LIVCDRNSSDDRGMNRRYHFIVLFALISAAMVMFPAVSRAEDGPSGGPVADVPEAPGRLLELINAERAQAGLHPLASRNDVAAIAATFSRRMAMEARVWHNQDYLSALTLQQLTAISVGENVSRTASVERTHVALMESPVHRANILSPKFRIVGIGVVRDSANNIYVTQDFLTPVERASVPPVAAAPVRPARRVSRPSARTHSPGSPAQSRTTRPRPAVAASHSSPVTTPPPVTAADAVSSPSPVTSPSTTSTAPLGSASLSPSEADTPASAPVEESTSATRGAPDIALDAVPASANRGRGVLDVVPNPLLAVAAVLGLGLSTVVTARLLRARRS
jgi:hypothetical protein